MATPSPESMRRGGGGSGGVLDPCVARLKEKMLTAPYEICMARALHFTRSYRQTEGMDPALRNALALKRTLELQRIFIYPDERIAGSKTEKYLAGPLSVERGDFLRTLQLEMDVLHLKQRPFLISEEDRRLFKEEILKYWDGRTVRDLKAMEWEQRSIIDTRSGILETVRRLAGTARFAWHMDGAAARKLLGANLNALPTPERLSTLRALRFEFARNNPTPAVYCFDIQGHLSLGVDKAVTEGMEAIIQRARRRMEGLDRPDVPGLGDGETERKRNFLKAVITSLQAAVDYAGRFAALAEKMVAEAKTNGEKRRLETMALHLRRVPANRPQTFHEALQAAWMAQVAGEIQYGTHEVFAPGRIDQYLYPFFKKDLDNGTLTRAGATALVQEFLLKLSANVEPIPEAGMETNGVLGNSQHVVTIGGLTPDGRDGTNELSFLILDAFEQMGGSVNQLSVRASEKCDPELLRRTVEVFGRANGIAVFNDDVIIPALVADGMSEEDARDYCIVGCIETSGQSDTHGCPGGHELTLPAVLMLTLSRGKLPAAVSGQQQGVDCGDPARFATFLQLLEAFKRQLAHQIEVMAQAVEAKDRAWRDALPSPYVSALMDDCIERARDITDGGARYDFTSLDVRGLATLVDSLAAVKTFVYDKKELGLADLIRVLERNFKGNEVLRQRLIRNAPKYGTGDPEADRMALQVVEWIAGMVSNRKNIRGGTYRVCYYSYGNHVIDGIMLGATPDGRRRGEPISNGISPANLTGWRAGPQGPLRSAAALPAGQASSGVSLNMRFHPRLFRTAQGVDTFTSMLRTYFRLGGMHLQPNVVSTETLRAAQKDPERHRDLVVKVSGYSAYFTDLGHSIQEDIIDRHEFGRD